MGDVVNIAERATDDELCKMLGCENVTELYSMGTASNKRYRIAVCDGYWVKDARDLKYWRFITTGEA